MASYERATKPTFYFIGVTTGQSSIMRVFPKWAEALGLDAVIRGIDLPLHAPDELYREAVQFLKDDPLSLGALVTTHKLDLYRSCHDIFDYVDPYAERLKEVSSLSKREDCDGCCFRAHAKDPISSGLSLKEFVPERFWADHGGEVLIIGAGGSALAMSMYLAQESFGDDVPKRITIANRSAPRLASAEAALGGLNGRVAFRYVHGPTPEDNDRLIACLPPYSLVVNATGLGKDAPGSPTTDAVEYPQDSLVWEINYRGDLIFMRQAQAQAQAQGLAQGQGEAQGQGQGQASAKRLHIEDGWRYFIHGWTQVIAEVFNIEIGSDLLSKLSEIALAV